MRKGEDLFADDPFHPTLAAPVVGEVVRHEGGVGRHRDQPRQRLAKLDAVALARPHAQVRTVLLLTMSWVRCRCLYFPLGEDDGDGRAVSPSAGLRPQRRGGGSTLTQS